MHSRNVPMARLFHIKATVSAQFFTNLRTPGSFGFCLPVAVTKFCDKFASLQQVKSPNSEDNFPVCWTKMYFVSFLVNFMEFCILLWISQDCTELHEICDSVTMQNIRSPESKRLKHTNMSLNIHYGKSLVRYDHPKSFFVCNKHRPVKTTCLKGFCRQIQPIFKLEDNIVISRGKRVKTNFYFL